MKPSPASTPATNIHMPPDIKSTGPTDQLLRKALVSCGIVSSVLYVAMVVFIAMRYKGYSSLSQTVSELSAIDAPTRPLWVWLAAVYGILVAAFGVGIRRSAAQNGPMRVLGVLMILYGIMGFFWPPMHQRDVLAAGGKTVSDTLHIVFTMVTVPLMLFIIGFGAAAFGKRFRLYSILTIVVLFFFGILSGTGAPRLEANLPTPWLGVWERMSIVTYMVWVAVLAIFVLRWKEN